MTISYKFLSTATKYPWKNDLIILHDNYYPVIDYINTIPSSLRAKTTFSTHVIFGSLYFLLCSPKKIIILPKNSKLPYTPVTILKIGAKQKIFPSESFFIYVKRSFYYLK